MKYCSQCGKPADDSAAFCQYCGQKFATTNPLNDIPLPPTSHQEKPIPPPISQPKNQPKTNPTISTSNIPNPQRTYARSGLFIALIGGLSMFLGINGYVDMNDGGGAMIMVGLFVVFIGAIFWLVFRRRAATLDSIIKGKNLLAAWQYDQNLWQQYTERERAERSSSNKATFGIIAFFIVVIAVGLLIFADFDEASIIVAIGMGGFLAFLAVVAVAAVWLPYRRRSALSSGRVFFSPKAIWVEGDFYEWTSYGMRLEGMRLDEETQNFIVHLSAAARHGRSQQYIWLPIPDDKIDEAHQLLQLYKKQH